MNRNALLKIALTIGAINLPCSNEPMASAQQAVANHYNIGQLHSITRQLRFMLVLQVHFMALALNSTGI